MQTRRQFLLRATGAVVASTAGSKAFAGWPGSYSNYNGNAYQPLSCGCCLKHGEADSISTFGYEELESPFGHSLLELSESQKRYFGRALARIANIFEVQPSFAFYDDSNGPNAMASPDMRLPGTWGSVIFGKTLFNQQFEKHDDGGVSIIAICAHEFGHILQYKTGYIGRMQAGLRTVKYVELQADYLAGVYLGKKKYDNPHLSVHGVRRTFELIGDTNVNNRGHHGTPKERVHAIEGGYKLGFDHPSISVDQMLVRSERFVRQSFSRV